MFKIEQNKFGAGTTVNVLISQKHGIRALIHDEFYPIVPLDDIYRTDTVGRTGDLPQVVIDLIMILLKMQSRITRCVKGCIFIAKLTPVRGEIFTGY
ncbi:hypothetical protein TPHV1_80001 [Treponema phagedenis]|uniref:Uncharacterized protein n=1 Tax=Treponema phagedenis TaxID=162 RepID=A0A0B7GXK8_TREPH|nr:hypothetical protein TPHV1_80001 [Treponema phagedenis]